MVKWKEQTEVMLQTQSTWGSDVELFYDKGTTGDTLCKLASEEAQPSLPDLQRGQQVVIVSLALPKARAAQTKGAMAGTGRATGSSDFPCWTRERLEAALDASHGPNAMSVALAGIITGMSAC